MPQMAPMNWIIMSSSFILILMIILSMIYTMHFTDKSNLTPSIPKEQIKWKW